MVRRFEREAPGEVRCCYEAGPRGYAVQRQIHRDSAVVCEVIAPSLIPVKPGERIKTDRRDARKLAELLRIGMLTEVRPPTPEDESIRDLCRCREDAKEDLMRARHRLGKLLLRRGLVYAGGKNWTRPHKKWLKELKFDRSSDRTVFDDYYQVGNAFCPLVWFEASESVAVHSLSVSARAPLPEAPDGRLTSSVLEQKFLTK